MLRENEEGHAHHQYLVSSWLGRGSNSCGPKSLYFTPWNLNDNDDDDPYNAAGGDETANG